MKFDDDVPGFGLRLRAGGSARWVFQYRQGSKQRRISLGSAAAITAQDAHKRATELHARMRLGEDPAGQKIESRARAAETLGSVLQPYLLHKKAGLKPRSYEEAERHLLIHAKRLHGLRLDAIDRRTVAALLTELATNNGPNLANNVGDDRSELQMKGPFCVAKSEEAAPALDGLRDSKSPIPPNGLSTRQSFR